MTTDQTKRQELWGRWTETLSARDLSRLDELVEEIYDQDCVVHSSKFPDFGRGPAGAKVFAQTVVATYSHIHLTVEDFFGEGDAYCFCGSFNSITKARPSVVPMFCAACGPAPIHNACPALSGTSWLLPSGSMRSNV
jgi:hypothetical protein